MFWIQKEKNLEEAKSFRDHSLLLHCKEALTLNCLELDILSFVVTIYMDHQKYNLEYKSFLFILGFQYGQQQHIRSVSIFM